MSTATAKSDDITEFVFVVTTVSHGKHIANLKYSYYLGVKEGKQKPDRVSYTINRIKILLATVWTVHKAIAHKLMQLYKLYCVAEMLLV